jgi:hypothetical protein
LPSSKTLVAKGSAMPGFPLRVERSGRFAWNRVLCGTSGLGHVRILVVVRFEVRDRR